MVTRRLRIATHSATEPNLCREMVAERISFLMAVAGMMKVMNLYLDTPSANPAPHSTQLSCRIQYKLGDMGFRGHGTENIHTFRVRHGDMGFRGDMGPSAIFCKVPAFGALADVAQRTLSAANGTITHTPVWLAAKLSYGKYNKSRLFKTNHGCRL